MENEKDFFELLVDETLKNIPLNSQEYRFKHKVSEFDLESFRGNFIPQTGMIQFMIHDQVIDIPSNWKCFDLSEVSERVQCLFKENDDGLCQIFSELGVANVSCLVIGFDEGQCVIACIKDNNLEIINEFLNEVDFTQAA